MTIELTSTEREFLAVAKQRMQQLQGEYARTQEEVNTACKYFLFSRGIADGNWTLDDQLRLVKPDEHTEEPRQ